MSFSERSYSRTSRSGDAPELEAIRIAAGFSAAKSRSRLSSPELKLTQENASGLSQASRGTARRAATGLPKTASDELTDYLGFD